jgi:hypothetical protein
VSTIVATKQKLARGRSRSQGFVAKISSVVNPPVQKIPNHQRLDGIAMTNSGTLTSLFPDVWPDLLRAVAGLA